MGTDRYPLPWNMLKYDMAKDEAPRYPENDLPAYTPEYGKKVDSYYGLDR